jgi:hypothetical protein
LRLTPQYQIIPSTTTPLTMHHLSICIPFHSRGTDYPSAIPIIRHMAALPYPVVICGSEGQHSYNLVAPYLNETTHYMEVPQGRVTTSSGGDEVLRRKFNDSLATLKDHPAEWYALLGANDFIPEYTFATLPIATGAAVAGVASFEDIYIADDKRAALVDLRYRNQVRFLPGFNAFNRAAMESCGWKPYQLPNDEVGMERLAEQKNWKFLQLPGYVVSLKDETALNSWRHIAAHHRLHPVALEEVREMMGP